MLNRIELASLKNACLKASLVVILQFSLFKKKVTVKFLAQVNLSSGLYLSSNITKSRASEELCGKSEASPIPSLNGNWNFTAVERLLTTNI
jgi:hypothetical protein